MYQCSEDQLWLALAFPGYLYTPISSSIFTDILLTSSRLDGNICSTKLANTLRSDLKKINLELLLNTLLPITKGTDKWEQSETGGYDGQQSMLTQCVYKTGGSSSDGHIQKSWWKTLEYVGHTEICLVLNGTGFTETNLGNSRAKWSVETYHGISPLPWRTGGTCRWACDGGAFKCA